MQRVLFASLTLALLSSQLCAQALTFDDFTWTFTGPASSSGFVTPDLMHVTGPSGDCLTGNYAAFTTTAPFAGTVRAWISWHIEDDCFFDWPGYFLNGQFVPDQIDFTTCWGDGIYTLEFAVQAGDVFGLGVNASDCFPGPGIADFTEFTFLPPDWIDAGGVLDPRLELDVAAPDPSGKFGLSLIAIGDVDGDGVSELASAGYGVCCPTHEKVHLLSGVDGAVLWSEDGPPGALPRMVAMGDVTGDGYPDVAVGGNVESVRMLSGADGTVHWTWTWTGSSPNTYVAVAAHADVDGDGLLDLAVGSGGSAVLPVRILSGSTGVELSLIQPPPGVANFGFPLAAPGDLDGDGIGELMIGELGTTKQVSVVSGASGTELFGLHPPGDPTSWKVAELAGIGDWDLDGVPDMAVGAPYDYDGPYGGLGSVALYSGATGDLLLWLKAPHELREFGTALAGGVDLTGDGAPELAIGAPSSLVYMGTEVTHVQVVRAPDAAVVQEITDTALSDLGRSLAWQTGAATPTLAVSRPGVGAAEIGHLRLYSDLLHAGGKPWLFMHGSMSSGLPWTARVDHGLPDNLALLCLGLSAVSLPFKGGVLVPAADLVVPVVLDAAGVFEHSADAPAGITPALSLWLQAWMPDPAGPKGWSATRAQMSPPP